MIYRKTYDLTAKLLEKKREQEREREMQPPAPNTIIMTPKSWREIQMGTWGDAE